MDRRRCGVSRRGHYRHQLCGCGDGPAVASRPAARFLHNPGRVGRVRGPGARAGAAWTLEPAPVAVTVFRCLRAGYTHQRAGRPGSAGADRRIGGGPRILLRRGSPPGAADSTAGPSARIRPVRTDRRPLVRGGHLGPWFRVPLPLFRRREPGPLRHGTLQRSAAVLVLHSNPHRRPAAVVDLRLPLAAAAECWISAGRELGDAYSADHVGGRAARDLLGFRGEATALHPSLPRAACDPPGIHDFQPRSSERERCARRPADDCGCARRCGSSHSWECFSFAQRRW